MLEGIWADSVIVWNKIMSLMVRINVTNTILTNAMSIMSISYHDKK